MHLDHVRTFVQVNLLKRESKEKERHDVHGEVVGGREGTTLSCTWKYEYPKVYNVIYVYRISKIYMVIVCVT